MMISDSLNSHGYPVRTETTDPTLHVCSTDEDESKFFIVHKNLSQSCYTDEDKSKRIIVNKTLSQSCSKDEDKSKGIIVNETLSQSCSTDKEELCSTEEDKSECAITKQKDANNEVTYDVLNYFNTFDIFECGRKLLDRIDMSYERACMATPK